MICKTSTALRGTCSCRRLVGLESGWTGSASLTSPVLAMRASDFVIVCRLFCHITSTFSISFYIYLFKAMTGSEAGLAISSAMALTGMFQWGVRQSAEVENQMTSVERVIEYSKLPCEAALDSFGGS